MLQSRSRMLRHIRARPYICRSCLAGIARPSPRAPVGRQLGAQLDVHLHNRALFSTTPCRANEPAPETPQPEKPAPEPPSDEARLPKDLEDHSQELFDHKQELFKLKAQVLALKASQQRRVRGIQKIGLKLDTDSPTLATTQEEAHRQLQLLHGALFALRNALEQKAHKDAQATSREAEEGSEEQNVSETTQKEKEGDIPINGSEEALKQDVRSLFDRVQQTTLNALQTSQAKRDKRKRHRLRKKELAKSTDGKPVSEEPAVDEPVVEEAVSEEPAVEEPVVEEPVSEQPVPEKPGVKKPSSQKAGVKKASANKTAAKKAPAKKAAVKETAGKKTTAKKVTAAKSSSEKPPKSSGWANDLPNSEIFTIHPSQMETLKPIDNGPLDVPSLSYGLDRVLFNPGVYFLQDPRSHVFNFDPYLARIMPIQEFDFNALKEYITSSKDSNLISIARKHNKKYTGSTSSMTSMLSHFHFLLSAFRPINTSMLSRSIEPDSTQFTRIMRAPAATFLHWKDGVYAIDADKQFDSANILSMLGKSMEKLLTLSKEDYEKYRHGNSDQLTEEERNADEAYHYTGFKDFMMRSQLDAYDKRVPTTGMFDLKTRAVVSIRMDAKGFEKGLGYEIQRRNGQWESFEREYYDMIRSAFLKYSLQVRMGRMDGIFVAFHNTQRIFGFQYISLPEMDLTLHGTEDVRLGDKEYQISLELMNKVLDRATERFPDQSLRMHYEARPSVVAPFMYVFAKPVKPKEIEEVQNSGKEAVAKFERDVLGVMRNQASIDEESLDEDAVGVEEDENDNFVPSIEQEEPGLEEWAEVMDMVEEAMEDDEQGVGMVREAIADALEQSSIINVRSSAEVDEYVDALLGALVGGENRIANESWATDETSLQDDEESQPIDRQSQNSTANGHPPPQEYTKTAEVEDEAAAEEAGEAGSGEELSDAATASPTLSPLKDLIVRMAQRPNGGSPLKREDKLSAEDNSKLEAFERILGDMISDNKNDDTNDNQNQNTHPDVGAELLEGLPDNIGEILDKRSKQPSEGPGEEVPHAPVEAEKGPILGMVLMIRNKVNGKYVERPNKADCQNWEVEYKIQELDDSRARTLYSQLQARRRKTFADREDIDEEWHKMWGGELSRATKRGRDFRKKMTKQASTKPVVVVGQEKSQTWEEVFSRDAHVNTDNDPGAEGGKKAEKAEKEA